MSIPDPRSSDDLPQQRWTFRVAEALEQLELGDVDGARSTLRLLLEGNTAGVESAVLGAEPSSVAGNADAVAERALEDDEIDQAFAQAESEQNSMLDATQVAQQAMRAAELDAPEGLGIAAVPDAMISRVDRAASERASTDEDAGEVVSTLEGWLQNLDRRVA